MAFQSVRIKMHASSIIDYKLFYCWNERSNNHFPIKECCKNMFDIYLWIQLVLLSRSFDMNFCVRIVLWLYISNAFWLNCFMLHKVFVFVLNILSGSGEKWSQSLCMCPNLIWKLVFTLWAWSLYYVQQHKLKILLPSLAFRVSL